jgi:hypothetical protein
LFIGLILIASLVGVLTDLSCSDEKTQIQELINEEIVGEIIIKRGILFKNSFIKI